MSQAIETAKLWSMIGELRKEKADLQKQLTTDSVNAYIFNPSQVAVAKKGLKGVWASSPIFANDLAALSWQ